MNPKQMNNEENQQEAQDMFEFLMDSEGIEIKDVMIKALYKDGDLLATKPDFNGTDGITVGEILLHVLVSNAIDYMDIEMFIKNIITIWGVYNELEE